jgi:hypothetical protein
VQLGHVLARLEGARRSIKGDGPEARVVAAQGLRLGRRVRGRNSAVSVPGQQALARAVSRFDSDHVHGARGLDGRPAQLDVFAQVQERLGCREAVPSGLARVSLAAAALPRVAVQAARELEALEADDVGLGQLELAGLRHGGTGAR